VKVEHPIQHRRRSCELKKSRRTQDCLTNRGAGGGGGEGGELDLVGGGVWGKAEETRSAEEGGFILLPLTWVTSATVTARLPPRRTATAALTTTRTSTADRDQAMKGTCIKVMKKLIRKIVDG
jgi:hypothetical protein